jgi:putative protease
MEKKQVGVVTHSYGKISVAVVELSGAVNVGDKIVIEGHSNSVEQTIGSMQVEHEQVQSAKKGQAIGLKTAGAVKEGDKVYKVKE